jgi:hypothetical protein
VLYRYGSSVAVHPTLLYEKASKGLVLRGEPTAQLRAPPVYLYGAQLLYEALGDGAAQSLALRLSELPSFGRELRVLAERYAGALAELARASAERSVRVVTRSRGALGVVCVPVDRRATLERCDAMQDGMRRGTGCASGRKVKDRPSV